MPFLRRRRQYNYCSPIKRLKTDSDLQGFTLGGVDYGPDVHVLIPHIVKVNILIDSILTSI